MKDEDMYRTLIGRGFVPYIAKPKPLANAIRYGMGLPVYVDLGGWLPPRPVSVASTRPDGTGYGNA